MTEEENTEIMTSDELSENLKFLSISEEKFITEKPKLEGLSSLHELPKEYLEQYGVFINNNQDVVESQIGCDSDTNKTLVILSPLSIDHKFGRNWVTKQYLNSIVERPQRLLAVSLGIAASLTMYPSYFIIRQCVGRSPLTSSHVLSVHGRNWIEKLIKLCNESTDKLAKGEVEIPSNEWNEGDIYLTSDTVKALEGVVASIESGIDSIFTECSFKKCFVAIRPPGHHSHSCSPSGFCFINNAHIGIRYAYEKHQVTHAVILDFDLHHGDGTQDICWEQAGFKVDSGKDEHEDDYSAFGKRDPYGPKTGYFSLHDINSFPTESGYATAENIKNASTCLIAHDLCIWNVHLRDWKTKEDFEEIYQKSYFQIFRKASYFLHQSQVEHASKIDAITKENEKNKKRGLKTISVPPAFKALVVISAGFDGSEYETHAMQRHKVSVPTSFYNKFTQDAVRLASKYSDGRIISFLEGGYSDAALSSGVFSHLTGLQCFDWVDTWGEEKLVKEFVKGCKPNWKPLHSKQQSTYIEWINYVCKIGRSMIPGSIIEPHPKNENQLSPAVLPGVSSTSRTTRSQTKAVKLTKEDASDPEPHNLLDKLTIHEKKAT